MTPTTYQEIIFITIMMWMGVGFYLVIIGSLSSYLFTADTFWASQQENEKILFILKNEYHIND